jgi:hypothetical protein
LAVTGPSGEMAYTIDLGSIAARRGGSSPLSGTYSEDRERNTDDGNRINQMTEDGNSVQSLIGRPFSVFSIPKSVEVLKVVVYFNGINTT